MMHPIKNTAKAAYALVLLLLVPLFGTAPGSAWAAPKTDVVVLLNGDRITGEFKELSYGQLKFKTNDMGTLAIEWDRIASITTNQLLQLELTNGKRIVGHAPDPGPEPGVIRVETVVMGEPAVQTDVPLLDIVRGATISEGTAWRDRLDGAMSLGYNYAKASGVEVAEFSGNVGSRNTVRRWGVALDAQLTSSSNAPSSQRDSLVADWEKFLADRYYAEGTLQFARNQELGLDLRSLVGLTAGRYLTQQPGREWRAGAGLAASTELGSDGVRRNSLWVQFETAARIYRFQNPEINVTAGLTVLPSINEIGRVRLEATFRVRKELVKDFFFELQFNDSYDNQPAETSTTNDFNFMIALGYSF